MKKAWLVVAALAGGAAADAGLVAHAVHTQVQDDGSFQMTVDRGSDDGVETSRGCQVLVGEKVSRARCAVLRVEAHTAVIATSIPDDLADHQDHLYVRFAGIPAAVPRPSVTGRALKLDGSGGDLLITVATGSELGVARTDTCVVLERDQPIAHAPCVIIRVDKRTTTVRASGLDRKPRELSVRFEPAR